MTYGFIKTACVSPELKVADCEFNAAQIISSANEAAKKGAQIIVFPELSITGYTCGDLFFQNALQQNALEQLEKIASKTKTTKALIYVGLPFARTEGIYNCAAALFGGKILALIPKKFLPNYSEFYERRQFTPFSSKQKTQFVRIGNQENIPFGTDILIQD